jgi:hypothetical protein
MTQIWYNHHDDVFACGEDNFFVARQSGKGYQFSSYPSPLSFYTTMVKLKTQAFHELIPEWRARRVHFDLDVPRRVEWVRFVDELLIACNEVLETQGHSLDPTRVVVLDASNSKKTSLHIILSNVVTKTAAECKRFCTNVTTRLLSLSSGSTHDLIDRLDMGIYQKNRCFRLPLCTKRGEERYLLPVRFQYEGAEYDHCETMDRKDLFLAGVIGVNSVDGCQLVSYEIPELTYERRDIENEEARDIVEYVKKRLLDTEWCFEVSQVKPGSIHLNRTRPGPCRICCRVHDRYGALIVVSKSGRISFRCWASDNVESMGDIAADSDTTKMRLDAVNRYIPINNPYNTVRTSGDYISILVEKYGWME